MNPEDVSALSALSYRERWHLLACARRGEVPSDPRMAAAAVEWLEAHQRTAPRRRTLTAILLIISVPATAYFAIQGDALAAAANALMLFVNLLHIALTPVFRPNNVARALEGSRRVAGG